MLPDPQIISGQTTEAKRVNMRVQDLMLENVTIALPQRVLFQTVDGGVVLLDIESGDYYGLNEVGSRIWALLQEERSPIEILSALQFEYCVPEERLRSDFQGFLHHLQTNGLIQINEHDSR